MWGGFGVVKVGVWREFWKGEGGTRIDKKNRGKRKPFTPVDGRLGSVFGPEVEGMGDLLLEKARGGKSVFLRGKGWMADPDAVVPGRVNKSGKTVLGIKINIFKRGSIFPNLQLEVSVSIGGRR